MIDVILEIYSVTVTFDDKFFVSFSFLIFTIYSREKLSTISNIGIFQEERVGVLSLVFEKEENSFLKGSMILEGNSRTSLSFP